MQPGRCAEIDPPRLFCVSIHTATAHSGFMDTAMNYAFWGIAALMISGFVLAVLVW